jgi:DNA-binding transcriptional ArsR family regulator
MPAHESLEDATSRIAAAIGEPARARMLFGLLDGRARTSTELALVADVSPSTASAHLTRLRDARLISLTVQGRHRYYRIENRRVAAAIERLSVLAGATIDSPGVPFRVSTPEHLVHARTCYDHIAGALGVALHDALRERGWVASAVGRNNEYSLTDTGEHQLTAMGIDVAELRAARRRLAFGCLDWSERRPHLGGALGAALLAMMLERRWTKRERDSRALSVTAIGRRELARRLGVQLDDSASSRD